MQLLIYFNFLYPFSKFDNKSAIVVFLPMVICLKTADYSYYLTKFSDELFIFPLHSIVCLLMKSVIINFRNRLLSSHGSISKKFIIYFQTREDLPDPAVFPVRNLQWRRDRPNPSSLSSLSSRHIFPRHEGNLGNGGCLPRWDFSISFTGDIEQNTIEVDPWEERDHLWKFTVKDFIRVTVLQISWNWF